MKYIILVLMAMGCNYTPSYFKNECVLLHYPRFFHTICDGAAVRIDSRYAHRRYIGTIQPEFVDKGCPEKYNFLERHVIEVIECPETLKK